MCACRVGGAQGLKGTPVYLSVPVSTLVWRTALCEQCICQKISLSRKECLYPDGARIQPARLSKPESTQAMVKKCRLFA
jgi:hypothetical protein